MNLIYRTKDICWPMIILIFAIWLLIGMIPLSYDAAIGYDRLATPDSRVDSERPSDRHPFNIPVILIFSFIIISLGQNVQVKAYKDKIVVHLGIIQIHPYEIQKENIIAIQSSPLPAGQYFPVMRNLSYDIDKYGWRAIVVSNINPGLMIQTKQRKYIISCHDAVKAAEFLRNAYGLPDIPIEPPPTWQD